MVDIVEIVTFRTKSWLPADGFMLLGNENVINFTAKSTYHLLSNHFRNETPSLSFSKICLSLACSRGSRRHLWSLSVCNQILSFGEQTGRTWFFIVMTVFDISKHFCPLLRLGPNSSMNTNYPDSSSGRIIRLFARIYTQTNCETNYRSLPKFVPEDDTSLV